MNAAQQNAIIVAQKHGVIHLIKWVFMYEYSYAKRAVVPMKECVLS